MAFINHSVGIIIPKLLYLYCTTRQMNLIVLVTLYNKNYSVGEERNRNIRSTQFKKKPIEFYQYKVILTLTAVKGLGKMTNSGVMSTS